MRTIRVYWSNGQSLATNINGSNEEIRDYYVGKEFNISDGKGGDKMATGVYVDFIDQSPQKRLEDALLNLICTSYWRQIMQIIAVLIAVYALGEKIVLESRLWESLLWPISLVKKIVP